MKPRWVSLAAGTSIPQDPGSSRISAMNHETGN
jgi:hypothetical protein